jgi:hypothetical protein
MKKPGKPQAKRKPKPKAKPKKPAKPQALGADAVSFATDIRPLFTDIDIDHMDFFCNLADYDDVKAHAAEILGRLNGTTGPVMPPKKVGGPWSAEWIALFERWRDGGFQP